MITRSLVWLAALGGLAAIVLSAPAHAGACCFDDGSCQELAGEECATLGGAYQGDASGCETTACAGACYFVPSGVCMDDTWPVLCESLGGLFAGFGTNCETLMAMPAGACCFYDDDCNLLCDVVSETLCGLLDGIYQGEGTDCDPDPCEDFGACCFPGDLSCLDAQTEQDCIDAGGVWQGACTFCDEVVCPVSGACCFPDGTCLRLEHDDCDGMGGLYQGFQTDCGSFDCTGACCFEDGTCTPDLTLNECELNQGGFFQGYGSTCDPNICPAIVQEKSYSWDQRAFPEVTDRVLEFDQFDDQGGLRLLEAVTFESNGQVVARVVLTNLGDTPTFTDLLAVEFVSVSEFPTLTPPPFVALDVEEFIFCFEDPGEDLPPGESCDYDSPVIYPAFTTGMVQPADFSQFIGPGTFEVTIEGYGSYTFGGSEFNLLQAPHKSEGIVRVIYEYSLAGACCFCDGTCEVLPEDECVNDPEFVSWNEGLDCGEVDCPLFGCDFVEAPAEGSVVCPDEDDILFIAEETSGEPGATFDWVIAGDCEFCETPDGDTALVCVDDVCGGSCTVTVTTTVGNCESVCERSFFVDDEIAPTIQCPPDDTFECEADIPDPATTLQELIDQGGSVSDNCPGTITIQWLGDSVLNDPCGGVVEREYQAEDRCGNLSDVCVQTFTIDDTTPPTIICPPGDTFECEGDVPPPAADLAEFEALGGSVSDNCDGPITIQWLGDSVLSDPCGGVIEREYQAEDQCGNLSDVCVQTFTIDDTTPPTIICPPGDTFECEGDIPDPVDNLLEFEALGGSVSDNCPGPITLEWVGDTDLSDPCGGTVERTYRATDQCDNPATCIQVFIVDDTTAPTITCPPDKDFQCLIDVEDPAQTLAEFEALGGSASDNCDGEITINWLGDTDLSDPCGGSIEREYQAEDACGNLSPICTQTFTFNDTEAPTIICPPDETYECEDDVPAPAADLDEFEAQGGSVNDNCDGPITITWLGDTPLTDPCGGFIERRYQAEDQCGNLSDVCVQTFIVDDTIPPAIFCPPTLFVDSPAEVPPPANDLAEFEAQGGSVSDNCDAPVTIQWLGDDPEDPDDCPFTIVRTYEATDACGNVSEPCEQLIICDGDDGEGGCDEKGSLVFFSKVELRWDQAGNLLQDTFLSLTNDYPDDVWVQMYFINGDPPLEGGENERPHPGWNWVDNRIHLTANQPVYWSVLSGLPAGVSPFTVLDPGDPPGRPAMDGTNDRVLRGYVVAWAVNQANTDEIKWNHLAGNGTLVHYGGGSGWEYKACAFQVVDDSISHGQETGSPGELYLDGVEYGKCADLLLMNFQAVESSAFSGEGAGQIVSNTDLTLHPVSADLRQNNDGPPATKADFHVWNQWEAHFSAHRCIACWDQTLLEFYSIPNHFLVWTLQTDHGKARFDGVASGLCNLDLDGDGVDDVQALPHAMIGLVARLLTIDGGAEYAAAGTSLFGMGGENALLKWDPEEEGPPPGPEDLPADPTKDDLTNFVDRILDHIQGSQKDH
ncbi:MAG: choice-of-anchor E domain-containing protein [Planctomycetota bacterium]|nr:choice-of-anchor E domain-containing protein [Planctomycetota bacterium]